MLILIDGYNVTMHDPDLRDRSKEAQRDALGGIVARRVSSLHGRGAKAVLVFDAHGSWGAVSEDAGLVKVVYANVADDEIVRRCAGTSGSIVVYTDDMRLRSRISQDVGRRVEYRGVSALFLGSAVPSKRTSRPRSDDLPPNAGDITAELAEHWLNDEGE